MPSKLRNFAKRCSSALLYKSPPLPQRLQGRLFWVHPRARFSVSTKTFFQGEPHVRHWLTDRLKPGDVFFDVGAHHGWVSMWALPLVGEQGAVYSFEPSAANLSILNWHKSANKAGQWTIIPRAVCDEGATERQFVLVDDGDSPMNSLTTGAPGTPLMEGRDVVQIRVQTISLDAFYREQGVRPTLVKIDVEGAELMVLNGARKLLSEVRPALIVAVHPYWLPAGQSTGQIVDRLEGYGYTIFDATGKRARTVVNGEYLCLSRGQPAG